MSEHIDTFKKFILNENKYDIDTILDKINSSGMSSLSFYEKQVLENPDIQKKLLYQYQMELNDAIELLNNFGIKDTSDIYIQETFYIDGEIMIGDYNEDKFDDIINKVGKDNFIYLNKFNGSFEKETDKAKLKLGWVGKINYSNDVISKIKAYPVAINFHKERIEFVFYNIENDEIIELSKLEKEFGFSSKKDINNYIKIIERLLKNKEVIQTIKEQTSKLL
jgi:hypothetical protein